MFDSPVVDPKTGDGCARGRNGSLRASSSPSSALPEFLANGQQIGSVFAVNSTDGLWSQFIAPWNSGQNQIATFQIVDTNLTRVGNDFTLDDLALIPLNSSAPEPATVTLAGIGAGLCLVTEK
jgi:hypothetical protein